MPDEIVFSRPHRAAAELPNLERVLDSDHSHGDGRFTASATARLRGLTGADAALLTTSCTHALELAMLLLEVGPGDEVVLPSFTFTSAATAVVSRGATPVFVDIEGPSGNLDAGRLAEAVTARTKAVTVMHYGGVPVDLETVRAVTQDAGIPLVEDNAHGLAGLAGPVGSALEGRILGTVGVLGTQSFHDTKNVHCGEGGALLVNDPALVARAEIIREKGTDRARFLRGEIDKYTWQDQGSSYLPSELNAAVLDAQLAEFGTVQAGRTRVWNRYARELAGWAAELGVHLMSHGSPIHSSHLFFAVMRDHAEQQALLRHLRGLGVRAAFHYVPLHLSPAGARYGRVVGSLQRTERFAERLVRLPLWPGLSDDQVGRVVSGVCSFRPERLRAARSPRAERMRLSQ